MVILVTGGADSGKSTYSEQIIQKIGNSNLYIATMEKSSNESIKRIKSHRKKRAKYNFDTLEKLKNFYIEDYVQENINIEIETNNKLQDYFFINKRIIEYDAVLFECIGNLVANHMFSECINEKEIFNNIKKDIDFLICNSKNIVFVTNDVSSEILNYGDETINYIKMINKISAYISKDASNVIELVHGCPIYIKGNNIYE